MVILNISDIMTLDITLMLPWMREDGVQIDQASLKRYITQKYAPGSVCPCFVCFVIRVVKVWNIFHNCNKNARCKKRRKKKKKHVIFETFPICMIGT